MENEWLTNFFVDNLKDDICFNELRIIVGESPYYEGDKADDKIKEEVILRVDGYPTEIVAFFRSDWSFNRSMIGIFNLMFGIEKGYEFLSEVKQKGISPSEVVNFFKEKNIYFFNIFKSPNVKDKIDTNRTTIQKMMQTHKGDINVIFCGKSLKKSYVEGINSIETIIIPEKYNVLEVNHPTTVMGNETSYKQWILFKDSNVTDTFRIFKS